MGLQDYREAEQVWAQKKEKGCWIGALVLILHLIGGGHARKEASVGNLGCIL